MFHLSFIPYFGLNESQLQAAMNRTTNFQINKLVEKVKIKVNSQMLVDTKPRGINDSKET